MAAKTNVPAVTFSDTGVTLPDESTILDGVLADIDTAFGGGMSKALTTPQGQLAQSLTAIVGDKNDQVAALVNNVNPDVAAGRWQDAIGRIYFLTRIAAQGTVVTGRCYGLVGTPIPAGAAAQDTNGYIYYSTAAATIGTTGYVDVDFQNSTTGPIACPIGNLSRIYLAVTGWDRVENLTAGTLGVDVETRADFEYRRRMSVAANARNSVQSVQAAVLALDGVLDAYVTENKTGSTVTKGATNVPLVEHSIYVAVAGGEAPEIADAIWRKTSAGCDFNGDTSYTVVDKTDYSLPYPSYQITWQTPDPAATYFKVLLGANAGLPSNIVTLVQDAIIAAFNGTDGGARARIGSTVYAGRFYAGVSAANSLVNIQSITLGLDAQAAALSVAYGIDQRPVLDRSNITVLLV